MENINNTQSKTLQQAKEDARTHVEKILERSINLSELNTINQAASHYEVGLAVNKIMELNSVEPQFELPKHNGLIK